MPPCPSSTPLEDDDPNDVVPVIHPEDGHVADDENGDGDDAHHEEVPVIERDSAIQAASAVHGEYSGSNQPRHVFGDPHVPLRPENVTDRELDDLLFRVDELTLAVLGNNDFTIFSAMISILHWRGDHQESRTSGGEDKQGDEEEKGNDSPEEELTPEYESDDYDELIRRAPSME